MAEVDAVVDDGDDHARVSGREAQGLEAIDVGVGEPLGPGLALVQRLAGVVQAPELAAVRLVGRVERRGSERWLTLTRRTAGSALSAALAACTSVVSTSASRAAGRSASRRTPRERCRREALGGGRAGAEADHQLGGATGRARGH